MNDQLETQILTGLLFALRADEDGDHASALRVAQQVCQLIDRNVSSGTTDYARSMCSVAETYVKLGEPRQAIVAYEEATASFRTAGIENDSKYVEALDVLAYLYGQTSRYVKAEPLLVEVASARRRLFGEQSPEYLTAVDNLRRCREWMLFDRSGTVNVSRASSITPRQRAFVQAWTGRATARRAISRCGWLTGSVLVLLAISSAVDILASTLAGLWPSAVWVGTLPSPWWLVLCAATALFGIHLGRTAMSVAAPPRFPRSEAPGDAKSASENVLSSMTWAVLGFLEFAILVTLQDAALAVPQVTLPGLGRVGVLAGWLFGSLCLVKWNHSNAERSFKQLTNDGCVLFLRRFRRRMGLVWCVARAATPMKTVSLIDPSGREALNPSYYIASFVSLFKRTSPVQLFFTEDHRWLAAGQWRPQTAWRREQ